MEEKTREKERWEIEELVFDRGTLLTLGRMIKKGIFEKIDYVISTGKEANVYRAKAKRGFVAVKIYKVETSNFYRRKQYLFSDPRFKFRKLDERKLIHVFASKEFKNLNILKKLKIRAPSPLYHENNIIVMSFLGRKGLPFPKLTEAKNMIKDKKKVFTNIIKDLKKMYKNNFVHGDVSEYNILFDPEKQKHYFIDLAQGTVKGNLNYDSLLERDVKNIITFFKKKSDVEIEKNKILSQFNIK